MKELRTYLCEYDMKPTGEELREAFDIAKNNHCYVELRWIIKNSGTYRRYISEDSDIEKMIDEVKNIIYVCGF